MGSFLRLLRLKANWGKWWKYQGFANGLMAFVGIGVFCNLGGTSICVEHGELANGSLRDLWELKFGYKILGSKIWFVLFNMKWGFAKCFVGWFFCARDVGF